jgi:hypothetical protein
MAWRRNKFKRFKKQAWAILGYIVQWQ